MLASTVIIICMWDFNFSLYSSMNHIAFLMLFNFYKALQRKKEWVIVNLYLLHLYDYNIISLN